MNEFKSFEKFKEMSKKSQGLKELHEKMNEFLKN